MDLTIWNILLSFGLGLIGWLARNLMAEQQRISILLNRTREEIAKEYVTKQEGKKHRSPTTNQPTPKPDPTKAEHQIMKKAMIEGLKAI